MNALLKTCVLFSSFLFLWLTNVSGQKTTLTSQVKDKDEVIAACHYEDLDTLMEDGLYQSALDIAFKYYNTAKVKGDIPEKLKAAQYILRLKINLAESSEPDAIEWLEKEMDKSGVGRYIMLSMLANEYHLYYNSNRYKISNISNTDSSIKNKDIKTWAPAQFDNKMSGLYRESISDEGLLQKTSTEAFVKILDTTRFGRILESTLYDLLVNRVIVYLGEYDYNIDGNADADSVPGFINTLMPMDSFLAIKFPVNTRNKYTNILYLYQCLLKFHVHDTKPDALVAIELKRIKLTAKKVAINDGINEVRYRKLLYDLEQCYKDYPISALPALERAISLNESVSVDDTMKRKKVVAANICNDYLRRYPDSYATEAFKSLLDAITHPRFSVEGRNNFPTGVAMEMKVQFVNVPKIYGHIYKVNINYGGTSIENDSVAVNNFIKMPPVRSFEMALPDKGDYESINAAIKLDALPNGRYVMLLNSGKSIKYASDVKALKSIQVSRLSYYVLKDTTKYLYVHDVISGAPVNGAKVNIYKNKLSKGQDYYTNLTAMRTKTTLLKSLKTDINGKIHIPGSNQGHIIDIIYQKDTLEFFDGSTYYYDYNKNEKNEKRKTHLFTDRSVYRPGQTVYFKGIIIDKNEKTNKKQVVTHFHDEITISGPNDEDIAELNVKTNDFGSFTGSFKIPVSTLNGTFKIEDDFGEIDVQVEEYKRPKTEVVFEQDTDLLIAGKPIDIKGTVKGYEGNGLGGVLVNYSIGNNLKPYMRNGIKYGLVPNGKVITDDKGRFKIQFTPPKKQRKDADYLSSTYYISVDVTDLSGESHKADKSIEVYSYPLQSSIFTESWILGAEKGAFSIRSGNGNGFYINAKGTFVLQKMKEPVKAVGLTNNDEKFLLNNSFIKLEAEKDVFLKKGLVSNKNYTFKEMGIKGLAQGHYRILYITDTLGFRDTTTGDFILTEPASNKTSINNLLYINVFDKEVDDNVHSIKILVGSVDHIYARLIVTINGVKSIEKLLLINHEQQWFDIPIVNVLKMTDIDAKLFCIKDNEFGSASDKLSLMPYEHSLQIKTITFRDKTEPGFSQHWQLRIRDEKGKVLASEMMASLYDASLDAIKKHNFNVWESSYDEDYNYYYRLLPSMDNGSFYSATSYYDVYAYRFNGNRDWAWLGFDDFALTYNAGYSRGLKREGLSFKGNKPSAKLIMVDGVITSSYNVPKDAVEKVALQKGAYSYSFDGNNGIGEFVNTNKEYPNSGITYTWDFGNGDSKVFSTPKPISVRKQLQELAFFYPQLRTNDSGDVILDFKMPEALTRWKLLAFAHTKDFVTGSYENTTVTRKPLMIIPNLPRFLREGDSISFAARVSSGDGVAYIGKAQLEILDPDTHKPIPGINIKYQTVDFALKEGLSMGLNWDFKIPDGVEGFIYRITASAGNSSDGEEGYIPVLPRRTMVTETLPMSLHSRTQRTFDFKAYTDSRMSSTATPYRYNLELSSNPAWYAVQSLPYLMEFPHECNEQLFNRIFANVTATYIVHANPKIKQVFESWAKDSNVKSPLEKNPELKLSALTETPWLANGKSESQRIRNIAKLFDTAHISQELEKAIAQLEQRQNEDGSWPWFPGMQGSRFITQYIFVGMAHLEAMRAFGTWTDRMRGMMNKTVKYMDKAMLDDYNELLRNKAKLSENHLSSEIVQYLYARCRYPITIDGKNQVAYVFWQEQLGKYWNTRPIIEKAMIATTMWTLFEDVKARQIMKALKEQATISDEMGMYWKENIKGYGWNERPVETQAMLLEAFSLIDKDQTQCSDIKTWLLKNKQTHAWDNTKATADACYAILYSDTTLTNKVDRDVKIYFGNEEYIPEKDTAVRIEAGTAWFSKSWQANEIKGDVGHIRLINNGNDPAWGAVYYQYMEDMNKVKQGGGNLNISKEITIVHHTANGDVLSSAGPNTVLQLGDIVRVRIIIKNDRELEYVQLKDTRAAALEPVENESGIRYKYGLSYYEDIKDASINFFMDYLPKGTHVFEYDLRASQLGEFLNGMAEIQCMYAPEFSSHTGGLKLKVQK